MQLDNFDIDLFLGEYWQTKPLLIKSTPGSWVNPLDPDELAGLACEDQIESRLIMRAGDSWEVENGPIPEERFAQLNTGPWTLLVQAVDHFIPGVAALIEPFRFIPNWRIDDVMVSYATEGGGVGPHFDQYDVFLIQGLGNRRWQIGKHCDRNTELMPNPDLKLLSNFEPTEEWICEPGDILYVPPGLSHNGISMSDDCMTYSVGFRAPASSELIGYWVDDLLIEMSDDDRYRDEQRLAQANPGEISGSAVDALHSMVIDKLGDKEAFARWFGEYNSTPKYPDIDWLPEQPLTVEQLRSKISEDTRLVRNAASRFAYIEQGDRNLSLFVDGRSFPCKGETARLAQELCASNALEISHKDLDSRSVTTLLLALFNQGSIFFDN